MSEIFSAIINNGVAIGMLCYFIYRDNKYLSSLDVSIQKLQDSIDNLKKRF